MTTTIRHSVILLFVSALALSGCATGSDDLLPVVPGGDPADDLLPVDSRGNDDLLPVEVDPEPDTPECLSGVWLLDNASYRDLLQPLAQSSGGSIRSVTGQVVLTFGDGDTFESLYDGWTIITDTSDGSATIERNGVDAGVVRFASGTFTLVEQQSGSSIEGFVQTPNGRISLPNVGTSGELIEETAGYRCSGDNLGVELSMGTLRFLRL